MSTDDISDNIEGMREEVVDSVIDRSIPPQSLPEQWNVGQLEEDLRLEFNASLPVQAWLDESEGLHEETLRDRIIEKVGDAYQLKEAQYGKDIIRPLEKVIMLQTLDTQWKEHLSEMDYLRKGIGLRGYAQKNPKQEYKREAFEMFTAMLDRVKSDVITLLAKVQLRDESDIEEFKRKQQEASQRDLELQHAAASASANPSNLQAQDEVNTKPDTYMRKQPKIGRNDPCYCGSGKKYKHCHGKLG